MLAAKRLIQKAVQHHHNHHQNNEQHGGSLTSADLDLQIVMHYGIPSTASLLAFDPIQRLLAIATLDGRIKVIGGDGIEAIFISPKQLPYKNIEFLQNQGFIVSISVENEIQVWNLESRSLECVLQWESNITAFDVIPRSCFIYIGDEYGSMSVVKYDSEEAKLLQLPYHITANSLKEAAGFPSPDQTPIVGVLPQPCSSGNRVLIAYQNGLIVLWDVSEDRIVFVGGGKDLQLKDDDSRSEVDTNIPEDTSNHHLQEKEISALCWASSNGSILAVGYVDGDILFWKTSIASSTKGQNNELSKSNIVKLQLSPAEKRLPVIVLHWSTCDKPSQDGDGRLFIYGGDEIGSEEVLMVLTLKWSPRLETVRCAGRVDITLAGSFADMILFPSSGPTHGNHKATLSVLTNPGQLHLFDDASLSALLAQQESKESVLPMGFPMLLHTADPPMTVAKFATLPTGGNSSKFLSKIASAKKHSSTPVQGSSTKWPLTGGVPNHLSFGEHNGVERMYIAGYQDGSVRLWNATHPVLSLIFIAEGEVQNIEVPGYSDPVTNFDFCSLTLSLAVGNECGLVRIYNLNGKSDDSSFRFVMDTKHEVHTLPQGKGTQLRAAFSLLNSPILALQFTNCGAKLAVGFECGRVAVIDMSSLSVLFFTDSVSGSSLPIISVNWVERINSGNIAKSPKHSDSDISVNPTEEVMFFLTKDATIYIIDGGNGSMISSHPWHPKKKSVAISMYVIDGSSSVSGLTNGKQPEESVQNAAAKNESVDATTSSGICSNNGEHQSSSSITLTGERSMDSVILLCCDDSLRLYTTKNVIQGNNKTICKVKLAKPCCWASTLRKDGKVCGVVLFLQSGVIEIRSFPGLELVKEISLLSALRWNVKANMEKMMSCDNELITLVHGSELAFISLLSSENSFRIPESFPCLHDEVLAVAANAAFNFSLNQKKQGAKPGILGGIVKGFKGEKVDHSLDINPCQKPNFTHLEAAFSKPPFPDSSRTVTESQEVEELSIDDIEIDEPSLPIATTSSQEVKDMKKEKHSEREQLLGVTDNIQPRLRTPEEIMAKYRKAGDASSAAANARNKLVERQEKLERISKRTAELQSGAEDFASLANELVKAMENRKWWQI